MKSKIVTMLAAVLLAVPMAANATPVALTISAMPEKNTTNPNDIQCVIYGNSCPGGQQEMAALNYKQGGNDTGYDLTALPNDKGTDGTLPSEYTVGYLENYVGRVFDIGIDVNTTGAEGEMLTAFEVLVNGNVEFSFQSGPYNIGAASQNGNGYFDWLLSTVDLSSFAATDEVRFHAVWDHQSDGPENFFLIRHASEVPEPATLALLGLGLAGLGFSRRRKTA